MKTKTTNKWAVLGLSTLMIGSPLSMRADPAATTGKNEDEKTYSGMIVSVDPAGQWLKVKGMMFSKGFHLGNACVYQVQDHAAAVGDLHPGQKVTVCYQKSDGVRVADRVTQEPMCIEGTVKEIDAQKRTMTVRHHALDSTFQMPAECRVALHDDKSGTFSDVRVGNHVTVVYEGPRGALVAKKVTQDSIRFTGELIAMDLNDRTLKVRELMTPKQFTVADHCAIVINGKPVADLDELKLGQKFVLDYYDVNGVHIVTRIANAGENSKGLTASERGNLTYP